MGRTKKQADSPDSLNLGYVSLKKQKRTRGKVGRPPSVLTRHDLKESTREISQDRGTPETNAEEGSQESEEDIEKENEEEIEDKQDDEGSDEEFVEGGLVRDASYSSKVKNSGRTNEELRALIESFSADQLRRYEVYRRSSLSKTTIKKVVSTMINAQLPQTLSMVVAGFSKVFVGEIVELALAVKHEWRLKDDIAKGTVVEPDQDFNTPLLPEHLREAYRRYRLTRPTYTQTQRRPKLFKR